MQSYFNARPSKVKNAGADVTGAARHRNATYESESERKVKAMRKARSQFAKTEKAKIVSHLESDLLSRDEKIKIISTYEVKAACAKLGVSMCETMEELRAQGHSMDRRDFLKFADTFNRVLRKVRRVRFLSDQKLRDYFKAKETYTESNGELGKWRLEEAFFYSDFELNQFKAVQFGNSLPDEERLYCVKNLLESAEFIKKYFKIDFSELSFAFGARGKKGSVAHFEPNTKCLSFNRHRDGAFIHELGHAVDYSLGVVSKQMPFEIKKRYYEKIKDRPDFDYLRKHTEIFARLFEVYCNQKFNLSRFQFVEADPGNKPEFCSESVQWLESVLPLK